MVKKHRSMLTIIGLLAIFIIIQACSLPIGRKTESKAEVIIVPIEEKTEEIFLPLIEGGKETEVEAEVQQPPTAEPIQESTHTPEPKPGTLQGEVFDDKNCDGKKLPSEDWMFLFTYRIFYLKQGNCGSPGETIESPVARYYFFPGLNPGPYCLSISNMQNISTSLPMDITIGNGEIKIQHVGYCR